MGNLASGHFKPTNKIQEQHNDRTLSPSYLIPQEFRGQNEVNRHSTQAIELKERIIENAINIYENTKKKECSQVQSYKLPMELSGQYQNQHHHVRFRKISRAF
ncbi:hypothetical protein ACQJ5W_07750 [Helicobacter pylori]